LHLGREGGDGLGIVEVALEGGIAHQQMIANQPGDLLRLLLAEAEPRAKAQGEIGPQLRVIAAAPLGDVMQQHREIEHPA
jgi:hypothetical protein